MTHLTYAQIQAAKDNDIDAVALVIRETEEFVTVKARRHAGSSTRYGNALVCDLEQVGRIAVWKCIKSANDANPKKFMTYIGRRIEAAMLETLRTETRSGASARTAKDFELALCLAGGDPYRAERVAVTERMGARRMQPDRARAARLAWQGVDSLDRPVTTETGAARLVDLVAEEVGMPADGLSPADVDAHRRAVIRQQVNRALCPLSPRQRAILKASVGMSPMAEFRPGQDDADLAAELDLTVDQLQKARARAKARFTALYLAGARLW